MKYIINQHQIIKLMEKQKIKTKKELAHKMGITPNQLSVLLSHKFEPIKSVTCKLATTLNANALNLITTEETQTMKNATNNTKNITDFIDVSKVVAHKPYTDVELFAGAGGLALGLEEAGFHNQELVEFDQHATETLKKNRPNWNVIQGDITKIKSFRSLLKDPNQEIDLLSGGYPCQSFSYAGKRLGLQDTRGTLFYDYARALKELKPKMFLVENVKGLTTMDHGKTLQTMINVFEDLGYHTQYKVLNAWDYGVAEKRQRMILIGIRNDLNIDYKFPKAHVYKPVLRDVLQNVPDSPRIKYSKKKYDVLKQVPAGGCWRDLPEQVAKDYMGKSYYSEGGRTGMARRLSWDEPSLTLTTSPSQKQTERCHPDETRPFTTREYARIQSFPDSWQFEGSVSSIYKQIGNAVAVNMAKDVGKSIINALNQIN